MNVPAKTEGVFSIQMGPAFFAVLISIVASFAQFMYSQGQQATIAENTKQVTEKLEKSVEKQDNRQNSLTERLVKVETIASTIQTDITSVSAKLDHIVAGSKLDKR